MEPNVTDAIIAIAFMASLVMIVRIISDNVLKRKLLASHLSDGFVKDYMRWTRVSLQDDALKWGILWISVGVALVVIDLLPYTFSDPLAYGLVFIFAGAGLIVYRLLVAENRA